MSELEQIRSGCVKGKNLSGIVAACFEVVSAFLRFEEVGAGFKEGDEASDGALGQLPQRGLQLGIGVFDGIEVRAVGWQISTVQPFRARISATLGLL